MARKLDPKVAEAVMLNAGLKPLEPYTGAVAKWKCLHIPCGEVVYAQYNMIQNGRGGCRKCGNESRFAKSRLTQSEVDLRLKEKGLIPLEKYFNSSTAFNCKCIKCGGIQEVKFRNINKVHGCAKCGLKLGGLKGRVSQEKAIKTMKLLDLEPLEPYVLSDKKWKCKCLRCGGIVFPTYGDATQGKRGCTKCGYTSSADIRRTSQKEAIAILKKAGMEPLVPYKNSHAKWKSRCLTCGKISSPMLASLKHQQGGCRHCAPNAPIDPKSAIKVMKKAKLEPLEPFRSAASKWKCKCLRCGKLVSPSFSKVQSGQSGCRDCGYVIMANKNRFPEEEAIRIMKEANLKPLTPYVGDAAKWKCECLKCGKTVYPTLTNIKQKNGGCLYGATKGIDFNIPAYLYFLHHEEYGAHKVGIGNSGDRKNDRIKRFQKYGWKLYRKWEFESGAEAHNFEQKILRHLRKELKMPPYLTLDLMKETGGHSETVDANEITFLKLEKLIVRIIEAGRDQ
jgi:DNA-directed RNA polymerase subunit M/transcription elongation factor TFIIS